MGRFIQVGLVGLAVLLSVAQAAPAANGGLEARDDVLRRAPRAQLEATYERKLSFPSL